MTTLERIKMRCHDCDSLEENDCWEWQDYARNGRDPQMRMAGPWIAGLRKTVIVRRLVYELAIGPIPTKRQIVVKCGSLLCVNPKHFAAKTLQQVRRADVVRGKYKGQARILKMVETLRRRSKLTDAAIEDIRTADISRGELAEKWGVHPSYVTKIRNCEARKDSNPFAGLFSGLLRQPEPA
jgi:hypothetical protein